ncbi:MAG: ABC transporter ATP-binding protein [Bacteroidia bacterium]|nr:ABC transporter ATP-binding protein [Bacteroidia bacterium]
MRNPYFYLLKTSWRYAVGKKPRYLLIYLMFIITNGIAALNPILYGWFVDALQRNQWDILKMAWLYALAFLGLRLLEWCFHGPARIMERNLAFRIGQNFLDSFYHQVLQLPVHWHQDHHSGSTINRLRKAYEALRNFFQNGFTHLNAFSKFFFSFAAMLYFSPLFGLVGVVIGAFTVWVIYKFDKPFIQSIKECNEKEHKMYATLFDSLSNITSVITLRLEKRMEKSLSEKAQAIYPAWKRKVSINEWKWFVAQMLIGSIYVIITVGYVYQNWEPGTVFYIGGLVTLLGYVNQFTSVFNDVAAQYTQIVQYQADIQAIEGIEQAYNTQHRPESTGSLKANWQEIRLSQLSFYRQNVQNPEARSGNLLDMHLRIKRGERIALIGESGSGKSTLLALLRGLYNPAPGVEIQVDGEEGFAFASIPNTVTLFPQEPEIFENTIRYNITLGLPFSDEEVIQACEATRFMEVVRQLSHGLDTNIQEKGVNLSGGQKQRLALARGILAARTSDLVLLDEPTSSVDPRTELIIYERLFETFAQKAVVSSLHRLHLLPQFDYVGGGLHTSCRW